MYSFYSKFDIEKHKKVYINYCEVIIDRSGLINYAVPSHSDFLESYCCKLFNINLDEFRDTCPRSMYCDYMTWLLRQSACVSCWAQGYMYEYINDFQRNSLELLIDNGLVADKLLRY